jgi:hypothetical protein
MTHHDDKIAAVHALRAEAAGLYSAQPETSKLSPEDLADVKRALGLEQAGICDALEALRQQPKG